MHHHPQVDASPRQPLPHFHADENVLASLSVDLDGDLRFAAGQLLLTGQRLLAHEPSQPTWREWPLRPALRLSHFDHAGVGTIELHDGEQRLAVWHFTLDVNVQALRLLEHFELQQDVLLNGNKELRGLVLDLRNNPGGLLDQAVAISDRFLPGGLTIVSTRARVSRGPLECAVVIEPSWPVFIAWSRSNASGPRTSPTMIRSGRMRRQFLIRSRIVTWPSPSMLGGRVSRRTTCGCCSCSSAASSQVMMRSVCSM